MRHQRSKTVCGLALWATYLAFVAGAILVALRCHDAFGRLVAIGLASIVFVQMTINTGMTIGLLPITGMTLPFVSYGGSSLVATWIMAGLILNVGLRRPRRGEPEPFVFKD